MSLVCAQCSRVNPPEAAYCHHDGVALAGKAAGPINAGSASFPNQFVFPNGLACRSFDQLAMACQEHWSAAIDLLQQGFLGSFFGGMGRVDLAMAAAEAAKFPDIDRGLDQLLAKLPTQALQAPKLQAEPSEINLGQVKIGQDRGTELHLRNLGMRLIYGNVTSDCKWLTIGEAPGHSEKLFQFGSETVLPIHVRGQYLRAASKPIEGHLVVDCNGGTVTVTVKADVPITPFPGGPFDGATTPRKIAETAKKSPKETASYFEGGAVASWYASNGWPYPVQGPTMSGMGAIQQFFEALGVAKAPKIEFSVRELNLNGAVGETVQTKIEVTTTEKKVVYGWATCDRTWVEIGKTKLAGKTATIPILVRIPSPAPPIIEAKLYLFGSGNQKLVVPLTVKVAGGKKGVTLEQPEDVVVIVEETPMVMVLEEAPMVLELTPQRKTAPPSVVTPPPPAPAVSSPVTYTQQPAAQAPPARTPDVEVVEDNPFAITDTAPARSTATDSRSTPAPPSPHASADTSILVKLVLMLVPLALLAMVMLVLVGLDVYRAPKVGHVEGGGGSDPNEAGKIDPRPHVRLQFDEGLKDKDSFDMMTFAVHKIDPSDDKAASVRLNWYPNGKGNSVVARINTKEYVFGQGAVGRWVVGKNDKDGIKAAGKFGGKTRTFEYTKESVFVTQTVTIEPSEPVAVAGDFVRPLSVCLARYTIHNNDTRPHKVGLRVLMDTCIGDNDGVPFTLPGVNELVSDFKTFKDADVPAFVQVLERPDLTDPGIVLQLNLRVSEKIEPPGKFLLTRWPGLLDDKGKKAFQQWDVPLIAFGGDPAKKIPGDSCVVMYWEEKELKAKDTREVGFTYGIGTVVVSAAKLGVTIGGAMHVKGELTVVALIADPNAKSATLELPRGLELLDGEKTKTQTITTPPRPDKTGLRPVPITWRVRAVEAGAHNIEVSTDTNLRQSRRVTITKKSLFN